MWYLLSMASQSPFSIGGNVLGLLAMELYLSEREEGERERRGRRRRGEGEIDSGSSETLNNSRI